MNNNDFHNALSALRTQGVIAYPTESVFGLGCDPDCNIAIQKILKLKQRSADKGLILIAANIEQLQPYADFSMLDEVSLNKIKKTWPGPFTWVVPAQAHLSKLISGSFDSVAVRVSDHPVVQGLCNEFNKPIISTSANLSGLDACVTALQVENMFSGNNLLNCIIQQPVSGLKNPSQIYLALTGERLR